MDNRVRGRVFGDKGHDDRGQVDGYSIVPVEGLPFRQITYEYLLSTERVKVRIGMRKEFWGTWLLSQ